MSDDSGAVIWKAEYKAWGACFCKATLECKTLRYMTHMLEVAKLKRKIQYK